MKPCFFGEQPNSLGMEGIDPGQVVCQAELLSSRLKILPPPYSALVGWLLSTRTLGGQVGLHVFGPSAQATVLAEWSRSFKQPCNALCS